MLFLLCLVVAAGEPFESLPFDQTPGPYPSCGEFLQADKFFNSPNAQTQHCCRFTLGKQELFTHCGYPLRGFPRTRAVCWQREEYSVSYTHLTLPTKA